MIFSLMEVGQVTEVAGWHVITTHHVAGWEEWVFPFQQGCPTFPDGPTVNYNFPTRGDYLRELVNANAMGALNPPIALPTPTTITMRQTRIALLQLNLLPQIENALNQLSEPTRSVALIEWNHGAVVERYSAFLNGLAAMLGFTENDIDDFFITASTL